MAGTYKGSSAALPGTTAVASGRPNGSRMAAAILNWGRSGSSLLWPNCKSPCADRAAAEGVVGELVGPDGLLVQVTFQGAEGGASAESGEPVGEPVVVGVGGQDGFAEEGGESALTLRDPRLDVVEAVVPPGDEEEQPNGEDVARGERAFP